MIFDISFVFFSLFFVLLFSGIIEIIRFHVPTVERFDLIFKFLAGIATFLITGDLYLSIKSNARTEENRITYNSLDNIQKNFISPQRELLDFYPESFFLYASMNPDFDFTGDKPRSFDSAKRKQIELYSAMRIFQSVEDYIMTSGYNSIEQYIWINGFLMWFQSPILQTLWPTLSSNYSNQTRILVTSLINSAQKLNELRKQKGKLDIIDYDMASQDLIKNTSL